MYMKFFILLIIVASFFKIRAQELTYVNYTTNDGLLSSTVNYVFQDKDGCIWIATKYGVSQFDGYMYKNYTITDGLAYNNIVDIAQDKKGVVWFLSSNFKLSYIKNDTIYKYEYNDVIQNELYSRSEYVKNSFSVDEGKKKFAINKRGLFILNEEGKLRILYNEELINKKNVIGKNSRGTFAIKSNFNEDTMIYTNNCNFIKSDYIFSYHDTVNTDIIRIADYYNYFFLANNTKIICFKNATETYSTELNEIIEYLKVINHKLWVATKNKKVYLFDIAKNGRLTKKKEIIKGVLINSITKDREGGFWLSTEGNGIVYIPELDVFEYKLIGENTVSKLTDIIEFDGNIYVGLSNGTVINITQNKKIIIGSNLKESSLKFAKTDDKLFLSFDNKLYKITDGFAKDFFNVEAENIEDFKIKFIETFANNILLSSNDGFIFLEDGILKRVFSPDKKYKLSVNKTYRLPNKTLLIASENGLLRYNNSEMFSFGDKNPLLNISIKDIASDRIGDNIFVATSGYGLLCIQKDTIISYVDKNLNSDIILSLCKKDSIMIIASNKGIDLVRFDNKMDFEIVQKYNKQYGLLSNEIYKVICYDSCIYAMSKKGVNKINYTISKEKSLAPKVFIKRFYINNFDTTKHNNCKLSYNQNHVSFDYIGLSYKNAGNIVYKYKLFGSKSDWVISKSVKAEYPFLPIGKYQFIVYASNEDGAWSDTPATFDFEILPPFWRTWWFIISGIVLFFLLITIVVRFIIVNIKRKEKLRQDLLMYRQQALRKQMNPHFIFNALNSIQLFILQNDKRMSNKYLNKFSSLMRIVLENSQNNLITIERELSALRLYLEIESIRFKDKFVYSVNVDIDIDEGLFKILPLLLQPYVENAIWHGLMNLEKDEVGRLNIDINLVDEKIQCLIIDNGVGREKAKELVGNKNRSHESLGTKINNNRIETFNFSRDANIVIYYEDLKSLDGKASGTKVVIELPIIK